MIRNLILSILATILIWAFLFFIERYISSDIETKYYVHKIYMPSKVKNNKIKLKEPPKVNVVELIVENKTDSPKIISNIKIYGLSTYYDYYMILTHADFSKEGDVKSDFIKKNNGEYFLLEDELRLKQNGTIKIYVWGNLNGSIYSTVNVANKSQVFSELFFVSGIDKYFSNYWKYILTLVLLVIVLIIYVYQTKKNKTA